MSSPSPTPSNDHKDTDDDRRSSSEPTTDTNSAGSKEKGKETAPTDAAKDHSEYPPSDPTSSSTSPTPNSSAVLSAGAWQAIFSPQHNAYYFYSSSTGETTWVNPLQSTSEAQDTGAGEDGNVNPSPYDPNSLEARAIAAGIDPSLAHLDPSLLAGPSSLAPTGTFSAKFNARTGTFAAANARAPSHLSEYERMKRMSEFYFDMNAWENDVEQRDQVEKEAGGKKRKRPTKNDLERFKEQKKLKKIAKTAWLRT